MKKVVFVAILMFGIANANAQFRYHPGIRAGVNLSKFTNVDDTSFKTDFYVGAQLGIDINRFYTIQPELIYSRQGSVVDDFKYSLDYVSLDVYNKFSLKGFHVGVGPSIDVKANDNFPDSVPGDGDKPVAFDISLLLGVGYTFQSGFGVEARLKHGILDVFGNDSYYGSEDDNYLYILNQSFQIGVSYTFGTKK